MEMDDRSKDGEYEERGTEEALLGFVPEINSPLKPLVDRENDYVVLGRTKGEYEEYGGKGLMDIGIVAESQTVDENFLTRRLMMDNQFPHIMFICGKRGSGKSYTLGTIAEELAKSSEGIGTVLVDPIGIFWSLKRENVSEKELKQLSLFDLKPRGFENVKVLTPIGYERGMEAVIDDTFSIGISEMTAADWCTIFDVDRFQAQGLLIGDVIDKVKEGYVALYGDKKIEMPPKADRFSMGDLIQCIEHDEGFQSKKKGYAASTRRSIAARFHAAGNWGLFSIEGTPLTDMITPSSVTVVDVSHPKLDGNKRALIVGILARKILEGRIQASKKEEAKALGMQVSMEGSIPVTWLLIDEAHLILPRRGKTSATNALVEYAKLGRKPGCALVLATQRPAATDDDVLSQVDTMISHNLALEDDIAALRRRIPAKVPTNFLSSDFIRAIPIGMGILADQKTQQRAMLVKFRPRQSFHSGKAATPKTEGSGEIEGAIDAEEDVETDTEIDTEIEVDGSTFKAKAVPKFSEKEGSVLSPSLNIEKLLIRIEDSKEETEKKKPVFVVEGEELFPKTGPEGEARGGVAVEEEGGRAEAETRGADAGEVGHDPGSAEDVGTTDVREPESEGTTEEEEEDLRSISRVPSALMLEAFKQGPHYLFKDEGRGMSEAFINEILEKGGGLLAISRTPRAEIENRFYAEEMTAYWLSKTDTPETLNPHDLERIFQTVARHLRENPWSLVYLDGLEYLISNNSFNKVMRFVETLHEKAQLYRGLVVFPFTPGVVSKKEMARLQTEMDRVLAPEDISRYIAEEERERENDREGISDATAGEGSGVGDGTEEEGTSEEDVGADEGVETESEAGEEVTGEKGAVADEGVETEGEAGEEVTVEEGAVDDEGMEGESEAGEEVTVEEGAVDDEGMEGESEAGEEVTVEEGVVDDEGMEDESEVEEEGTGEKGAVADEGMKDEGKAEEEVTVEEGAVGRVGALPDGTVVWEGEGGGEDGVGVGNRPDGVEAEEGWRVRTPAEGEGGAAERENIGGEGGTWPDIKLSDEYLRRTAKWAKVRESDAKKVSVPPLKDAEGSKEGAGSRQRDGIRRGRRQRVVKIPIKKAPRFDVKKEGDGEKSSVPSGEMEEGGRAGTGVGTADGTERERKPGAMSGSGIPGVSGRDGGREGGEAAVGGEEDEEMAEEGPSYVEPGTRHLYMEPGISEMNVEGTARRYLEEKGFFRRKKIEMVEDVNLTFLPLLRIYVSKVKGLLKKKKKVYVLVFDTVTGELVTKYKNELRRTVNANLLFELPRTEISLLTSLRSRSSLTDIELKEKTGLRPQDLKRALKSLEKKGLAEKEVTSDGFYKYRRDVSVELPSKFTRATPDLPYIREADLKVKVLKPRFGSKEIEKVLHTLGDGLTVVDKDTVYYPYYIVSVKGKRGPRTIFMDGLSGERDETLENAKHSELADPK